MKLFGYVFGNDFGLAIPLEKDDKRKAFSIDVDLRKKYQKRNDIAIVLYQGGPEFSTLWTSKFKNWSEDLFGLKNDLNLKADFYLGVCSTWKGVCFDYIFKNAKAISQVEECGLSVMLKKPNDNDQEFAKNFWISNPQKSGEKVLESQNVFFETLAKNLKNMGYKKVYYIAHSWAGGLINSWIHSKGDKVFANIDKIFTIATKLIDGFQGKQSIKEFAIPFYLYNHKTKKYDIVYKQKLNQTAIVIDTFISTFFALSRNYDHFWLNLSLKNRAKYYNIYTNFDFRMGSFSQEEKAIANDGINLINVKTNDLIKYKSEYLKTKKEIFNIKYMDKFRWFDSSFHNDLLNYFINNFNQLYLQEKSNLLIPKKDTFWALIK